MEIALNAACSRLAICNDVEVTENSGINMQVLKILTGGDSFNNMTVRTTMITCMNKLVANTDVKAGMRVHKVRRIMVVTTVDRRASTTRGTFNGTSNAKKESIMHALTMYVNYALPPMTTCGLLHSLFHVIYSDVCNIVKMDGGSLNLDCILATAYLCARYGISFSDLQMCLSFVGTCCCIMYEECLFIHGIRPIPSASIRPVPEAPVDARHGRYNRGQPVSRVMS